MDPKWLVSVQLCCRRVETAGCSVDALCPDCLGQLFTACYLQHTAVLGTVPTMPPCVLMWWGCRFNSHPTWSYFPFLRVQYVPLSPRFLSYLTLLSHKFSATDLFNFPVSLIITSVCSCYTSISTKNAQRSHMYSLAVHPDEVFM